MVLFSPNVAYVPEYPDATLGGPGARIFDDGMYGFDEVCKWPGQLNNANRHLACIPVPPSWRRGYHYKKFSCHLSSLNFDKVDCLWDNITPKDFTTSLFKMTHTDPHGYGSITQTVLDKIVRATDYVESLRQDVLSKLQLRDWETRLLQERVEHLHLRISDVLSCMRSFNDNWFPTLFRYRELQRCNLEILGHLVLFGEILEHWRLNDGKPPEFPLPLLGAFVSLSKDMSTFIRGGIPCWKIVTDCEFSDTGMKYIRNPTWLPIRGLLSLDNFKHPNGEEFVLYRDHRWNQHSDFGPNRDLFTSSGLKITLLPSDELRARIIGDNPHLREDIISALSDKNLSQRFAHSPVPFVLPNTSSSSFPPIRSRYSSSADAGVQSSHRSTLALSTPSITFKRAVGDYSIYFRKDIVSNFWYGVTDVSEMQSPYSQAVGSVYTFPTPTLFVETKNDNRGQRFIVWLSMRLSWIHSAFTATGHDIKPLSTETWRMLTSGKRPYVEINPGRHNGKFDRRQMAREAARQLRETLGLCDYHPGLTGDWGNSICTASTLTAEMQAEIIYELHHMNFLSDFLSLDALEMRAVSASIENIIDSQHRKNRFLAIFNHETILDPEEVRFPDVWSLPLSERRKVLSPWFTMMLVWPSCLRSLSVQVVEDLNNQQFEKFERDMVRMYVLFFARSFRRYPILPIVRPTSLQSRYEKWLQHKLAMG